MGTPQTILVVDDERNLCRIVEAKLRRSGFHVVTAYDAASGLAHLLRRRFDLVLLDIHLPDADAIAILPRLRAAAPDTPFLLMTAYEEENLRARAAQAGAVEVLYKPFDLDYLVQAVRLHVAGTVRLPAAETGVSVRAVPPGQAVVLQLVTGPERGEYPARVTGAREDTFAVQAESAIHPEVGRSVLVRMTGEDGLYQFQTRVVAAQPEGHALVLAKPSVIRRRQRRRHLRVPLSAPVRVRLVESGALPGVAPPIFLEGMARDVSMSGMALVVSQQVAPGQRVELTWSLPPPAPPPSDVRASGVVLRCESIEDDGGPHVYRLAVRFPRLSPASRARLRAYIAASPSI